MRCGQLARACAMLTALTALTNTACSEVDQEARTDGTLELFSWWNNAGESAALEALLDLYTKTHPRADIVHLSSSQMRTSAQIQLDSLMASGASPDTFQSVGGADVLRWVTAEQGSELSPVDDIAAKANLLGSLPREIKNALSRDDSLYGIPLDVPRMNVLFYNVQVFKKNKLTPPTTLDELYEVAEALAMKGIVPLALGGRDGSIFSQLLLDALLVRGDSEFRDAFLEGDANPEDARVNTAVSELGKLLTLANTDRNDIDWTTAARKVVDGAAAMTFVGDFAKAYLASAGLEPGVELGQLVFPETEGTFVYLVDAFVLPRGAPHPQAAENFLRLIGGKEASATFVAPKGTTSARLDFDVSRYDVLAKRNADDFRSSKLTLGHVAKIKRREFLTELDATLHQFSRDGQESAVLNMLRNRYGQL